MKSWTHRCSNRTKTRSESGRGLEKEDGKKAEKKSRFPVARVSSSPEVLPSKGCVSARVRACVLRVPLACGVRTLFSVFAKRVKKLAESSSTCHGPFSPPFFLPFSFLLLL